MTLTPEEYDAEQEAIRQRDTNPELEEGARTIYQASMRVFGQTCAFEDAPSFVQTACWRAARDGAVIRKNYREVSDSDLCSVLIHIRREGNEELLCRMFGAAGDTITGDIIIKANVLTAVADAGMVDCGDSTTVHLKVFPPFPLRKTGGL